MARIYLTLALLVVSHSAFAAGSLEERMTQLEQRVEALSQAVAPRPVSYVCSAFCLFDISTPPPNQTIRFSRFAHIPVVVSGPDQAANYDRITRKCATEVLTASAAEWDYAADTVTLSKVCASEARCDSSSLPSRICVVQ